MRRYLLFAGSGDCPLGGWQDLQGSVNAIEEAMALVEIYRRQADDPNDCWAQIVDAKTLSLKRIARARGGHPFGWHRPDEDPPAPYDDRAYTRYA